MYFNNAYDVVFEDFVPVELVFGGGESDNSKVIFVDFGCHFGCNLGEFSFHWAQFIRLGILLEV